MKDGNIILIGMTGSGKSTVGGKLAERLGWTLVDTDQRIMALAGKTIGEIFAEHGEPYFRQLETEVVRSVLKRQGQVISTGGGAVLAEASKQTMKENGVVVQLYTPIEAIIERLRGAVNRPLLQGDVEQRLRQLAEQRKHAYDFANLVIDTSQSTPEEIADQIMKELERSM